MAVHVKNLEESMRFYEDILGFVLADTPASAQGIQWYDLPNGTQLHLFERDIKLSVSSRAHFAIEVADLDSWRNYLTSIGTNIEAPTVDVYTAKRLFLRDPSGNLIELVQWL